MAEKTTKPRGKPFRPGNEFRFHPGEGGRKAGALNDATLISEATRLGLQQMVDGGQITVAKALALRRIHIGLTAKPGIALQAIESIEDRLEGRPVQAIDMHHTTISDETAKRIADIYEAMFLNKATKSASQPNDAQKPRNPAEMQLYGSEHVHTADDARNEQVQQRVNEAVAAPKLLSKADCPTFPNPEAEVMARLGAGPATGSAVLSQGRGVFVDLNTGDVIK